MRPVCPWIAFQYYTAIGSGAVLTQKSGTCQVRPPIVPLRCHSRARRDMRVVGRSIARRPGLVLGAFLVLAAALGFNTAAFSILNTLLFRPYPYPKLSELVIVRDRRLAEGAHQGNPIASGDFIELRRDARAFAGIAAFHVQPLLLTGTGEPDRIEGVAASASFFEILVVRTVIGR